MLRPGDEASGGGGGIRTHGALSDTRDFQSRPLGLYGTPPKLPRLWKNIREGKQASRLLTDGRKGRDSNPRCPIQARRFSRAVP